MRSGSAPVVSAITSLIRRVVPSSMPFIRLTSTQSRGSSGSHSLEVLAQGLRRDGQHDDLGAVQRLGRVGGGAHRLGQRDARQVVRVLVAARDGVDDLGAAAPQHDVGTGVGQHHRERGAPRPGPQHGHACHAGPRVVAQRAIRGVLMRLPVVGPPRVAGHRHAGSARVVPDAGSLLAPDLLQQCGHSSHDALRHLVQERGVHRAVADVVQVDRRAGPDVHRLPREQVRPLAVRRQDAPAVPTAPPAPPGRRSPARPGRHRSCRPSATARGRGSAWPPGRWRRTRPARTAATAAENACAASADSR